MYKDDYENGCPFCDTFSCCEDCLWPGRKIIEGRCYLRTSSFYKWQKAKGSIPLRKQYAKEILNLLESIEL